VCVLAGGIELFVQLAARGSTDRASGGAARALAVLLQPPVNTLAQVRVLNAGGTNALVALLHASPRLPAVENAIEALEGLIRDNPRAQVDSCSNAQTLCPLNCIL